MTSRTSSHSGGRQQGRAGEVTLSALEQRRQLAVQRYLDGDPIAVICREMGCSKSWLYKWRDRYQADDPAWAQAQTRRPRSNPRQTPDTIAQAIIHLYQAWESQESGR